MVADGYGSPPQIIRTFTVKQCVGYLNALSKRRHTERAFQWQLTQALVATMGGKLKDFPDYAGTEEEYDAEWIERQLARSPFVRRMQGGGPAPAVD